MAEHVSEFEVVSIKPSGKNSGTGFAITQDGFRANGYTLKGLVMMAYLPMPLWSGDRVQRAPDWAQKEEYDVVAKLAPGEIPLWTGVNGAKLRMEMLQSMLVKRFKLVTHTTPVDTPAFALVTTKQSPNLKPSAPHEALPRAMALSSGGVASANNTPAGLVWEFHAAPMASLVDYLSHGAHTTIEDRTGLKGPYDFVLRRRDDADSIDRGDRTDPATKWELGLLGLKTIPIKVPSVIVIIDHAERPSPN